MKLENPRENHLLPLKLAKIKKPDRDVQHSDNSERYGIAYLKVVLEILRILITRKKLF